MKFDSEGCLKIFDFGLARDVSGASTIGERGTTGYMAPELFSKKSGDSISFTSAIDVFAFGSTALAVVYGKVPKGLRQTPPVLPCAEADFSKLPIPPPNDIADTLNRCLSEDPLQRPTMDDVVELLALHLVRGQHRALLVAPGGTYTLDSVQKAVQLSVKNRGDVNLAYDGLRFIATYVSGDVFVNNQSITAGFILPGSCVITLGSPDLGARRVFITVDISHPEIAL
jgi:serine/threonine-protein kinase